MAVQQNSLKYFGGQQSGSGEAKLNITKPNAVTQVYDPTGADQTLDISAYAWLHGGQGNDSDPYKCNSRLYNPTQSGTTNFSVEQVIDVPDDTLDNPLDLLSLVSRCYDEDVKFVTIRYNDDIYWLTSYSPDPYLGGCLFEGFTQSISIGADGSYVIIPRPSGSGGDQFVLVRTAMATAFTNQEYQDCMDAVTAGKAVCVQFSRGGIKYQAQLTAVDSSDNLIFEVDSEAYHFKWQVRYTNNNHMITERVFHLGVPIFPSLQDAIGESASLDPGMCFETNGFHTSGDGGAARYEVSSTGTANGMDIVQLDTGKLAVLQINQNREMYPEQFGYDRFASQDLTPVLTRMTAVNVRNIRLMPCGSDNYPYLMKTGWTISSPSVQIAGYSGLTTGYASRIWFKPDSYDASVTPMFSLTQRDFIMKDVVIMNRPWFTEGNKHNCVCIYMAVQNTNKMWYDFTNIAIQGFDIGIAKVPPVGQNADGLIWHCEFHKLQMALNNKNVYFKGLTYLTKFDNCFFTVNDSSAQSISLEEGFTVEFDRCNFGIYNPAETVLRMNKYVVSGASVDVRWSSAKFTNCNFEIESNDSHPLPTSNKGYFLKCDNDDDFHLEFDNCFFISTPLARANNYGNRAFSLGNKTSVTFTNCVGSYADVCYTGNEFYEWDFQKRMFDESRPPKLDLESVIIEHTMGIITPPNNQWGSIYLPTVKTDEMSCFQSDNNTKFVENYPTSRDGVMLLNLDTASVNTKIGSSLVQVTAPASGKIKIGDRIYDYVTIDGRKWITTNLQLWTMNTRQWHYPNHPEFGFYYGTECFAEVDALLPTGWRRPTLADCTSLASQGAAALQKTGYTAWPSATNSSGFSALPSDYWRKPNQSTNFTRVFLWGYEEVGVGWHTIYITNSNVTTGGWTYVEAATRQCNLRVCCDA